MAVRWRGPKPTDWALNSGGEPISGDNSSLQFFFTHGDETETGGARKALSDAPEVGDDFDHIFDSGLKFGILGVRAIRANRAFEGGKFRLNIGHKSKEVLRERGEICELLLVFTGVALGGCAFM